MKTPERPNVTTETCTRRFMHWSSRPAPENVHSGSRAKLCVEQRCARDISDSSMFQAVRPTLFVNDVTSGGAKNDVCWELGVKQGATYFWFYLRAECSNAFKLPQLRVRMY